MATATANKSTKAKGRPAGPPATNLRVSVDVLPMLMEIKHRMETDQGKPVQMRAVVDFAISKARDFYVTSPTN